MKNNFCTFFFSILSVFGTSHVMAASSNTDSDLAGKLFVLRPLPKVHYFWPPAAKLLGDRNSRKLYELARITHSLCVSAEVVTNQHIDNCVYICTRVNKTRPAIKASLGINFSPWHRKFGKNLPPTDRGPSYREEIRYFEERMRLVKQWVEQSNRKYGSEVQITALLLDHERFVEKPGNQAWNDGMREALDAIHIKAKTIFPTVRIEWFVRGIQPVRVRGKAGWAKTPSFTGREIKNPFSVYLYSVPDLDQMRETYRRTCELADGFRVKDVTPWVALGAGYRPSQRPPRKWHRDWDYDLKYSHQIGAELNLPRFSEQPKRYASYNRAKVIIFYPGPFDKRTPGWARHFIAYVRGATGVKELKDFGYEE
ncbi:MAG: hypothetical protein ACYTDW_00475 [Planctomycetota bacterium]|jgi:hypothetical protein